jgi:hypothetical protein
MFGSAALGRVRVEQEPDRPASRRRRPLPPTAADALVELEVGAADRLQ